MPADQVRPAGKFLARAAWLSFVFFAGAARATSLDITGFTALRAEHPELTGSGQSVAVAEAGSAYQIDPAALGQPAALFHYYDTTHVYGSAGAAFNAALASTHAKNVGSNLFGSNTGGAPGVQAVENFEASYFAYQVVDVPEAANPPPWQPVAITSPIVNQSFIFDTSDSNSITVIGAYYDAYANLHGTLFVNGLKNNTGTVTNSPASMYNGIAVGRTDGNHSGRAQLVAPGGVTSYATPYVSAAAVVLRQAAELDYFSAQPGTDPTDARVLKSGLLNGAAKMEGWMQTPSDPLDAIQGAGIVNVKGAFDTLSGGQHLRSVSDLSTLGTISTSTPFAAGIASLNGWDLNLMTARINRDAVNHYFFDLGAENIASFTATLTWNSIVDLDEGLILLSDFDLVLVDTVSNTVVWSSSSTTENVEHIYLTGLSGSKYDLQVILRGGSDAPVLTDTYAVSWSWLTESATPVPESDFAWIIVLSAAVFVIRKRFSARRSEDSARRGRCINIQRKSHALSRQPIAASHS